MKTYPSIPRRPFLGMPCIAFDKLDGSNVRAEWTRKRGFWKFGRRHGLLDHSNPVLLKAEKLIQDKYGDVLSAIFRQQRWEKATAFFEFWGPESFAGLHREDDDHTVTLFDVDVSKQGILEPREFLKLFKHLDIPNVVYEGNLNMDFMREVRYESYAIEGLTFEGVVCKASRQRKWDLVPMCKIKTRFWLDRVWELHMDDPEAYALAADDLPEDFRPEPPPGWVYANEQRLT